jgi:hypothetical protein
VLNWGCEGKREDRLFYILQPLQQTILPSFLSSLLSFFLSFFLSSFLQFITDGTATPHAAI